MLTELKGLPYVVCHYSSTNDHWLADHRSEWMWRNPNLTLTLIITVTLVLTLSITPALTLTCGPWSANRLPHTRSGSVVCRKRGAQSNWGAAAVHGNETRVQRLVVQLSRRPSSEAGRRVRVRLRLLSRPVSALIVVVVVVVAARLLTHIKNVG